MATDPAATVVVGAYNAMPYLTRCVSSVLAQSIGLNRLELVAVDDGSTDGTGEELERFAASYPAVRVVHQKNSGGPAAPRNRGIELARGRYLFFLDADDYLGREALERMVAMAERNGSDVVVGRRVGLGGRGTPQGMFGGNQDRADLFASRLWYILSAQKLFRRALIDRLHLRFPDLPIGQDQPFSALAYLHAGVISVLADYDCYYLVRREDGGNNTTRQRDIRDWLRFAETMMRLVAEHVPAGDRRDALIQRHFKDEFRRTAFAERYLAAAPEVQAEAVAKAKALIDAYYTPGVAAAMPVDGRLKCALISRGLTDELAELVRFQLAGERGADIVDNGRVYAAYPFFQDKSVGIPDEDYDITERTLWPNRVGWATDSKATLVVGDVPASAGSAAVLLTRADGVVHRVPAEPSPDGAAAAVVPLATAAGGQPLQFGRWRVDLEFAADPTEAVPTPRPPALRRRVWWRRGVPAVVGPNQLGRQLVLTVAPLLSVTVARAALAAGGRRLSRWLVR